MTGVNHKANIIASGLDAMLKTPLIRVYLDFIDVFSKHVHLPFMEWSEQKDQIVGMSGLQAREVLAQYFVYDHVTSKLEKAFGCPDSPEFEQFRKLREKTLTTDDIEKSNNACHGFFKLHKETANKMFARWTRTNLLLLAIFSSSNISQIVACLLLDLKMPEDASTVMHYSVRLSKNILLNSFICWNLDETKDTIVNVRSQLEEFLSTHKDAVTAIAHGCNMWDTECCRQATFFSDIQDVFHTSYQSFPCHNQRVEAGVKKSKEICSTGRHSQKNSAYAVASNFSLPTLSFMVLSRRITARARTKAMVVLISRSPVDCSRPPKVSRSGACRLGAAELRRGNGPPSAFRRSRRYLASGLSSPG